MQTKKEVRRAVLSEIDDILPSFRVNSSCTMRDIILGLPCISACKSVFIFQSFNNEVDTTGIVAGLLKQGKTVGVPKIVGDEMLCVELGEEQLLNGYGIYEPVATREIECEVAVVPAVAFDLGMNRLGRGKGYYDSFFCLHPKLYKVGVGYDFQILDCIPHDINDVKMDIIVSERRIIGGKL